MVVKVRSSMMGKSYTVSKIRLRGYVCVCVCALTRWCSVPTASRLRLSLSCMSRILARLRVRRPCASELQQKKSFSTPRQQVRSIPFRSAALKLFRPLPPSPSVEFGPSKVGAHHLHYNPLHYNLLLNYKDRKVNGFQESLNYT